jgi:histidinol dehydrogenase
MSVPIYTWSALPRVERATLLQRPAIADDASMRSDTSAIIAEVRRGGDASLREFNQKFDRAEFDELKVDEDEISRAEATLSEEQLAAIDLAIDNVRCFHTAQLPPPIRVETQPGVICERYSHPIDAVGLYVPAGTAPLPSAAIMLAVPADIAACPVRILCTPPRSDGTADPAVVVAATRAGVRDIFKVGGAQAIAAMAYGTESIPKVRKIFGPGNAWVTCAKTLVSGDVSGAAIDMPAGPSEVLVIADENACAEFVASDLLSQAEHGTDSQVILVTTSDQLARQVVSELDQQIAFLSRKEIAAGSLESCRILVVDTIEDAVAVSNTYAPEHLIVQVAQPRELLPSLRNAGSIFLGEWTPESVGDYCSGTNHVLPTYGFAQAYSGLGVDQFMRQMTVQELSREGLQGLGDAVVSLAGLEGLDAHAAAVTRRLKERP